MSELWDQYSSYILIGAFIFLMLRMHRSGGGCCGGGHQNDINSEKDSREDMKENNSCH